MGVTRIPTPTAVCSALVTIAALSLVTSCSSSGSSGAGSTGTSGTSTTKGQVKVALVLGLTDDPFMHEVAEGSQDAATALGAKLTVTGPPAPNPTVGINQLAQVVAQGVDGVTIFPLPASLWSKAISSAAKATKVNIINDVAVQGIPGSQTYIGNNSAEASRVLLDAIIGKLGANPSGEIVLGNCIPGVSSLDTRIKTYVSHIHEKMPNVKLVPTIATTTDPVKNLSAWTNVYNAHPNAIAYIGNCDSDGPSLVRLHQQHPGNYLTGTFDVNPSTLTGIRDGDLSFAIDESPYLRGYLSTAALILQAQGKPAITGFINIKGELIDKSNAESIITREATAGSRKSGFAPLASAFLSNPKTTDGPVVAEPIASAYQD